METNFETQAAAATDLGGIEVSKNRLVITIGLGTITYNEQATAIIIAAGEAKAPIVKMSLETGQDVKYPATALQKLKNSRFYITEGASKTLRDTQHHYWQDAPWDIEKKQNALLHLAKKKNIYGKKLSYEDLVNDPICKNIPGLNDQTVDEIIQSIDSKVQMGIATDTDQVFTIQVRIMMILCLE